MPKKRAARRPAVRGDRRCDRRPAALLARWSGRRPRGSAQTDRSWDSLIRLSQDRIQIFAKAFDARRPGAALGWRFGLRPVAVRPLRGLVLGIAAEFQDVRLRDAQVLEQHPRRVRACLPVFDRVVSRDAAAMASSNLRGRRRRSKDTRDVARSRWDSFFMVASECVRSRCSLSLGLDLVAANPGLTPWADFRPRGCDRDD